MERGEPVYGERAERKKRLFVEIGTNSCPVPFGGTRVFGEDERYFGVDVREDEVKDAKVGARLTNKQEAERLHFAVADGRALPLADRSADEVFMGNVFGAPGVSEGAKMLMLKEAARVIREDGRLTIKENNTPWPIEETKALLASAGFDIENIVDSHSPDKKEVMMSYDQFSAWKDEKKRWERSYEWHESYIIFAKPRRT